MRKGQETTATPPLRRAPRGKPFEKGNQQGLATRFVKGICPNPGGRPATAKYSEALRRGFALRPDEKLPMGTNAEVTAAHVIRKCRRGKLPYIREAGDRSEGRPMVSLSVDGSGDNFAIYVASMTAPRGEDGEIEHPENWIPPLPELPDGEDAEA